MTTTPTPEEMTVQLHKALDAAVEPTADDISNVQSLMDVDEWLVAFEMLCTQAFEWGVVLEPDVIRDLERVRRAGGVPVIAHPWGRGRDKELTPAVLSELTMENRLEGIEVDHPDHDADTRTRLRGLASRLGLLTLGSSDHHGLGKVNNPLACETTDPDVYNELVRRIRARGGQL